MAQHMLSNKNVLALKPRDFESMFDSFPSLFQEGSNYAMKKIYSKILKFCKANLKTFTRKIDFR